MEKEKNKKMKVLITICKCKKTVAKCSLDEFNNKFVINKKRLGYKIRFVEESLVKIDSCICKNEKTKNENLLF